MEWRRQAACAGDDRELFFPIGSEGPARTQIAAAKAICARCPVREACLRYAVTTGQGYGIWGGLTADERRGLRYQERSSWLPAGTGATLASTATRTR
ncbi:MAG: WhiB family transcriptional regulator [Trebonia sp.]